MRSIHDPHSRLVFWLKIVLPLTALVILSTLFLFSRQIDTDGALPYSDVDVQELARDQRMTKPEYSAVTTDGAAVRVDAGIARPGQGVDAPATADDLVVAYDMVNGLRIDISATTGQLDRSAGRVRMSGGVEIVTSSGYRMLTDALDTALDRTELHSEAEVAVEAPYGHIDAGRMQINHVAAKEPGYVLVFDKGVKLIYEPAKKDGR
ncbi:MAG: hypothetical protein R3E44_02520 [Paracoccaceae bacterium]